MIHPHSVHLLKLHLVYRAAIGLPASYGCQPKMQKVPRCRCLKKHVRAQGLSSLASPSAAMATRTLASAALKKRPRGVGQLQQFVVELSNLQARFRNYAPSAARRSAGKRTH